MASSAVSSVLYLRDAAGNHAETLQVQISTLETQQVSTNGNFALDFALLVKLVINTSKRCPKSVTDCVVTHSSRHKKLDSIICAKWKTAWYRHVDSSYERNGIPFD